MGSYPVVVAERGDRAVGFSDSVAFLDMADQETGAMSLSEMSRADLELTVMRARWVADNWRKAAMKYGDDKIEWRTMAHPLCCVLAALDGGKRPADLGVDPESEEGRLLAAIEDV